MSYATLLRPTFKEDQIMNLAREDGGSVETGEDSGDLFMAVYFRTS